MDDGTVNGATGKENPRVVEIIGPAGAGKTTLLRALSRRHTKIQTDINLSKIGQVPFYLGNALSLLPTYAWQYRHSRWFNRRETRSMAYVKAGLYVLARRLSNNGTVSILDHGPIYRLAFLRALGPEITESRSYKRWWNSLFDQWIAILDMIIWLDAPNAILLERIRARDSWHTIKEKPDREAYEYLSHYRTFLEQSVAEAVADGRVTLLHFDTDQESVEQIAGKILTTFNAVRQP